MEDTRVDYSFDFAALESGWSDTTKVITAEDTLDWNVYVCLSVHRLHRVLMLESRDTYLIRIPRYKMHVICRMLSLTQPRFDRNAFVTLAHFSRQKLFPELTDSLQSFWNLPISIFAHLILCSLSEDLSPLSSLPPAILRAKILWKLQTYHKNFKIVALSPANLWVNFTRITPSFTYKVTR